MPEQFRLTKNNTETIRSANFSTARPGLYLDPEAQELYRVSGENIIEVKATQPVIETMFTEENKKSKKNKNK